MKRLRAFVGTVKRAIDGRDVLLVSGACLFVAGVDMIYRPAALMLAGVALIWFALYGKKSGK